MGNVNNQPCSGRPRSTTQREDQYITNWTFHQSRVTARQLHDHLRTTTGTLISHQTKKTTPGKQSSAMSTSSSSTPSSTSLSNQTGLMHTSCPLARCPVSSLMSLGLPYYLATAGNGCTGVLDGDLLTLTSINICRLVVAVSWFGMSFRSMIRLLFMSLMVT